MAGGRLGELHTFPGLLTASPEEFASRARMEAAPPPPPPVAAWEADGDPGGPGVETHWEGGEASQPGAAPSQAGGLEAHWEACWSRLVPRLSTLPDQPACLPQLAEVS